jgi:hypothetical protein
MSVLPLVLLPPAVVLYLAWAIWRHEKRPRTVNSILAQYDADLSAHIAASADEELREFLS